MSDFMTSVDQRTNMVGQNRMELLMFRLNGNQQMFGINVFKVREVTQCPKLTVIPNSHPAVRGIADFRGTAIPVIDFCMAIGGPRTENIEESLIIISEYNRSVQALIVSAVERIVNLSWEKIMPPPPGTTGCIGSYLTAVTEVDKKLVEIIDVERVLTEVQPRNENISEVLKKEILDIENNIGEKQHTILVADDSFVARNQIQKCMGGLGIHVISFPDGKQALDFLKEMVSEGKVPSEELLMVVSDIEMPIMDGYTLTTEIRLDDTLKDLFVVLHTSLSGVFNQSLVEKVGANKFIAKFQPDALGKTVEERIEAFLARKKTA